MQKGNKEHVTQTLKKLEWSFSSMVLFERLSTESKPEKVGLVFQFWVRGIRESVCMRRRDRIVPSLFIPPCSM